MKKLLTAVIISIILVQNLGIIHANASRNTTSQVTSNPHFPQWVPADVDEVILFCTGGWLRACGVNSLPLNWNREWVHMSRDNSQPEWNSPQFTSGRQHQGILHPNRSYLSLVAVRPNGTWGLAQPSTAFIADGYDIFWANVSSATTSATPSKVEEHFINRVVQPVAPLWYNSRLSNNSSRNQTSNQAVKNSIYQFYNNNLTAITEVYQGWNSQTGYAVDRQLTVAFRDALMEGFRQDSIMQAKPFSLAFVDEVISNVYFYFADRQSGQQCIGRYNPNLGRESHIWVATGRTASYFTRTALHELGHAFGLGETLADLQKEMLMGFTASNRAQHNLAYNSTFDRMLLERVGASAFWAAAYHSNKAYATLWDDNFGNIITHAELEVVRGVALSGMSNANTRNSFASGTGTALTAVSYRLSTYMQTLLSQNGATCQNTLEQFRTLVDTYVTFANNNNLSASHSVLDGVIERHNERFAG